MKFATLKTPTSRDGRLVIISPDGKSYTSAPDSLPSLQFLLDNWTTENLQLCENLYQSLAKAKNPGTPINDYKAFHSPLPRAYEWIDASSFINHVLLVRKARGAEPPPTLRTDPLVYQGGSGVFLAPNDNIPLADESWGCDFESEVCVVLGDTPQGTKKHEAEKYIKLILICNDVSLRNLIPAELEKGFGFFNSKPASAFSPFALTPDELGKHWKDGRLHLNMDTWLNDKWFGSPNAGPEMHFSFFELIEHICKTRSYTAGTILGSGTVSNEDRSKGSSCLAEKRMIEKIESGTITTPFLKKGDRVKISVSTPDFKDIFGTIEQTVL
jgi:fumarylacetoacetate (FAA) hydrolase